MIRGTILKHGKRRARASMVKTLNLKKRKSDDATPGKDKKPKEVAEFTFNPDTEDDSPAKPERKTEDV